MKFETVGYNQLDLHIYGILLALRYPMSRRHPRQRISFAMFISALGRVVRSMETNDIVDEQYRNNVNEYLYFLMEMAELHGRSSKLVNFTHKSMYGTIPVPYIEEEQAVHFRLKYLEAGQFSFELDTVGCGPDIQAALMMQWACLDYSLTRMDITIENRTLSMGMWIAAKLYECQGDIAGKLATIDEALDMRR